MSSATSKMSCRLWLTSTTARPCSPRRLTRSSTCRVWATPSAAVGSSRITTLEFHITALATATDWRWPPDSPATVWRTVRSSSPRGSSSVSLARFSIATSSSERSSPPSLLAAQVHVLDDVEVVGEREVLVDDLDPSAAASFGPWIFTGSPSKRTSPESIG